jgi:hypothetical protein
MEPHPVSAGGGRKMRLGNIIEITDHLILPFGTAKKFDLQKITLAAVAANGIYLRADIPCVYISVAEKKPLRFLDFFSVFRRERSSPKGDDVMAMLDFMHQIIAQHMPIDTTTRHETTFLKFYFDFIKNYRMVRQPFLRYNALMPIPQMQLYVHDVLDYSQWTFEPNNNFRVDFGFWTGTKLIAVEIDGNEPEGYARDIRRDRLLRRADVDVVHILNTEIDKHGGENLMVALLPQSIAHDWTEAPVPERPPS